MRLVTQILLLQQKDLRLLWRRKLLFLLEIAFALLCLPGTIWVAMNGRDFGLMENGTASTDYIKMATGRMLLSGTIEKNTLTTLQDLADKKFHLRLLHVKSAYNYTNPKDRIIYLNDIDIENKTMDYRIHKFRIGPVTGWVDRDPYLPWRTLEGILKKTFDVLDPDLLKTQATWEMLFLGATGLVDLTNFPGLNVEQFPRRDAKGSTFLDLFPYFYVVLFFVTLIPMVLTARDVLHEKEADIKTYMMSMGMSPTSFYFSHFLSASWKISIITSITSFPIMLGLEHSYFHFGLFVFLYAQAAAAFALLVATVFRRPVIAYIFTVMVNAALCIFTVFAPPDRTKIGTCFVYALSPITALGLGIWDVLMYERFDIPVQFFGVFPYVFTWEFAVVMLVLDVLVLVLLANYLDAILPNKDGVVERKWYFPIQVLVNLCRPRQDVVYSMDWNGTTKQLKYSENIEPDSVLNGHEVDIEIDNLVKTWPTGEVAVNGIFLKAYRGNVTVLLGHNGAGKSSTFACLTGFSRPTSGTVRICGESVVTNLRRCQSLIGYCPQTNPLFNNLTVYEHMVLYGRLRCGRFDADDYVDITNLLRQVGLLDHMNELAHNLSGGMKRKLFVALALVGKAQVVLLDEPTAGMDPGARQQIRNMLMMEKRNRTILLTTHYMDEADLLGDRVAIMVKGEIVCNGSVDFLKQKYGTGYILTVVLRRLDDSSNPQALAQNLILRVLEHIKRHIPTATIQGELIGLQEFKVLLAYAEKSRFAAMFEELEYNQEKLLIDSFGLSINSLEQVFIRIRIITCHMPISESRHTGFRLFAGQVGYLLWRHALYYWRNKMRLIAPLCIAVILFIPYFLKLYNLTELLRVNEENVILTTADLPNTVVPLNNIGGKADFIEGAAKYMDHMTHLEIMRKELSKEKLNQTLFDMYFHTPPLGIGYSARNGTELFPQAIYYNERLNYGSLYAMNTMTNTILANKGGSITMGLWDKKNHLTDQINDFIEQAGSQTLFLVVNSFLATLTFGMNMAIILSLLILNLTAERFTNFKHQIFLTQIKTATYWLAQYISDLVFFVIGATALFLLAFWSMNIPGTCVACLWPIWIMYFLSAAAITYCFSFMFRSAAKAFAFMFCWHTIIPSIISTLLKAALIFAMFQLQSSTNEDDQNKATDMRDSAQRMDRNVDHTLGIIFPGVLHFTASITLLTHCQSNITQSDFSVFQLYSFEKDGVAMSLVVFLISFLVFTVLLTLIQGRRLGAAIRRRLDRKYEKVLQPLHKEDEDVIQERHWMTNESDYKLSLAVRQLYKYHNMNLCAVRNLTFGVRADDCFGLLGVNGAGKTSTFDILTAVSYPTAGRASINGINVSERPPIGYCPQFDALSADLTGRETLQFIGALNGLEDVEWRVERVLESIQLTKEQNKLVKYYSGGQKRRISIGVALMSCSRLIMLDEPTAGVDPRTRRHIWNLLTELRRNNTALLLTTHSMEECEILCTRIGFMNKGSLISIGTSQHLKSKYGNTFLLTIALKNPSNEAGSRLNSAVCVTFGAAPTTDAPHMPTLSWQIPRRPDQHNWSDIYKRVDEFVRNFNGTGGEMAAVRDYSLVQSSLEQVFIHLSKLDPAMSVQMSQMPANRVGTSDTYLP
ncbi:ABC transporter domain-containing protein [Ditylenchus destructor]|uniref:ABC transporter domain-containing protein n=1 Tax=Ditylenchus destructor TaxID=166010 RepID=A0AAD4MQZ3_9BILA|nr:ABC transporter domain-containing protein [Ditylenchus destructor]